MTLITNTVNLALQNSLQNAMWLNNQSRISDNLHALDRANTHSDPYPYCFSEHENALSWLLEMGSMTQRIEALGYCVSVVPHQECFISEAEFPSIHPLLSKHQRYWLRDITLYANEHAWLVARTIIPEETLRDDNQQLVDLGTIPLGRYLFSHPLLTRDFIDVGFSTITKETAKFFNIPDANAQSSALWARQSLLRINQKPLLLAELFLPQSSLGYLSEQAHLALLQYQQ